MDHAYRSIFLFIFLVSCSKQDLEQRKIPEEVILARVGPGVITIQDFIRRSEYSIRPGYCRQDNYIHKKIILNSLIAEKNLNQINYRTINQRQQTWKKLSI